MNESSSAKVIVDPVPDVNLAPGLNMESTGLPDLSDINMNLGTPIENKK